jgi:argininosuccinate lyase
VAVADHAASGARLWGGRFSERTDAAVDRLNRSIAFDGRLWPWDIRGSIAHTTMLGETGIIEPSDADSIIAGLQALEQDLACGAVSLDPAAEDVHTAVEDLLRRRLGPVAGRLHTARSRNDQVATDVRLYLREAAADLLGGIRELQRTFVEAAEREFGVVLPGCTHLQHAQPVLLSHHLLAYFWMLQRDAERLSECARRANRLPLGAGALAGTGFPINRRRVAELLGFDGICENSMDAVSDRDFVVEFVGCAALLMTHLSRFAEELILWSTPEFGYVRLSDAVTTGSSIMPQKKNPDVAELVRGKTGRVCGHLTGLLMVIKGQPLAYNKDMQEDKEPLFDTVDTLQAVLPAFIRMLATAEFRRDRMAASLTRDFSTATDVADWLVRQGMPFREAHGVVGRMVRHCEERGIGLEDLKQSDLEPFSELFRAGFAGLDPESSARSRTSEGGTGHDAVRLQLDRALELLSGAPA